jgi:transposase
MAPEDAVDTTHHYHPVACAHCSGVFEAGGYEELEPQRHQVVDVPEVKPSIVEHRLHVRRCGNCQGETVAAWPEGVPRSCSGPRLQAWVSILTVRFRLSKRESQSLLKDLLGIAVSLGGISDIEQYVSEVLAAPVAEIQSALKSVDVAQHDETGWRQENQKAWVWVTISQNYAVYRVDLKRNGEVARSLLDSAQFLGTVVSDRYKAYNCYPMQRRGICHSHLGRDYKKIADREGPGQHIGKELCTQEAAVFTVWHLFTSNAINRQVLCERMAPISAAIKDLLVSGAACTDSKVAGMCTDILRHWDAMWTFTSVPGVEPTNNLSEQALRPYVLWRKGSFGTQSERGSRFMERMMSVIQTCRRQGRHLLSFLTQAIECWNCDSPAPSLILNRPG